YVPPQARYMSGSGFDQLKPMCTVAPPTPPEPTPTPGPSPTPLPVATPTSPPIPTPTPLQTALPTAAPTVAPTPTSPSQSGNLPPIVGAALVVKQQPPSLPQCS